MRKVDIPAARSVSIDGDKMVSTSASHGSGHAMLRKRPSHSSGNDGTRAECDFYKNRIQYNIKRGSTRAAQTTYSLIR